MTLPDLLHRARRGREPAWSAPVATRSPVASFIRRAVFLIIFLVVGLLVLGLLSGGPLLEILLTLLLNSGRY